MLYNDILNDFTNNLKKVEAERLCKSILDKKEVFKGYWNTYKQIYKFEGIPSNICNVMNFNKDTGYQLVERLKNLPFDVFMIKPCEFKSKHFNILFQGDRINTSLNPKCDDRLLLVSYFVVNRYLCIYFSPTNLNGEVSQNSFVIKFDLEAPISYSLSRFDSELAGLKYGTNIIPVQKLQLAGAITNSVKNLLIHLLYLSMCYERELPKNINYITSNRTYNSVSDYKITINISNKDFSSKVISNREVKYYKKNDFANGTSKSTHARRGHIHRFWTGSGENKKLIEKWVKPTIINEGKEELRTLVTNVI